jgi:hypothetical protein
VYCTVSCLKNAQNIKNDAIEAYALLIRDLREFEPTIFSNLALEDGLAKIKP